MNIMLVSVAMIVRDEEKNIERALRSVLPVADEIVILDTGSADRTKEIITGLNEPKIKLSDHEWKDDFSEARNASIALCTGDWIFVYDGDEELTEEAQKELRPLLESQPPEVNTVSMITRNIITDTLSDTLTLPRIFRRGTIAYKFSVHNHPQYEQEVITTNLTSKHYGYQWTPELREKKRKRLLSMMEKILKDGTLNEMEQLYYKAQYYKTLLVCERKEEAYAYGKALFSEIQAGKPIPVMMHDMFILLGLQALEYCDPDVMRSCIQAARGLSPDCPDSFIIEELLYNTLKQPLNTNKAFDAYMSKMETYDKSECPFTLQYEKYNDIAKIIGAKAAVETGITSQGFGILRSAKPTTITTWAVDELITTLAKTQHVKVLKRFEPAVLKLADRERINLSPYYSRLYSELNHEMATKRKKIAIIVAPGLASFLHGARHELALDYIVQTAMVSDIEHAKKFIEWADLVWYEFGNELAIAGTNKYPAKKTIIRVHAYEAYSGFLKLINYNNVDCMMFEANHIYELAKDIVPADKVALVPMGVDTKKFVYGQHGAGYKIAYAGHINALKNPMMMVQIMSQLVRLDSRYELYWAGEIQDIRLWQYLTHIITQLGLERNIHFVGYQKDMNAFFEDKNYFLSTSYTEGTGMAILEAESKGIKPIIHHFWGATDIYPNEYLYNTVDEAVRMILEDRYDCEAYRLHAEGHGEATQLQAINEIIKNLLAEPQEVKVV
jgi:glycosyltransferase involved in cell wall biosynthesis